MNKVNWAASHFIREHENISRIEEYGEGIIHDTYLVRLSDDKKQFILQRINTQVFANPEAIMHNLRIVSEHIDKRMRDKQGRFAVNWQVTHGISVNDGSDFFIDADGGFWRALSFIRGATPLKFISSLDDAREVGRALGIFHWLTSDLAPGLLHDTLPGFHNVEQYLAHYDEIFESGGKNDEAGKYCQKFIEERRSWAPVLENACRKNLLKLRVVHGDPKINNIMVDSVTGKAVSIIDLDTVMPGLVQYDIGDCLRSSCNTSGEDAANYSLVQFDLERCKAVLSGYTGAAMRFLTTEDVDYIYDAIRLIPFELGLRFYTDFLQGNVYFKVNRPDQNLDRAMVQFKLAESIELQEGRLRAIIKECHSVSARSNLH